MEARNRRLENWYGKIKFFLLPCQCLSHLVDASMAHTRLMYTVAKLRLKNSAYLTAFPTQLM